MTNNKIRIFVSALACLAAEPAFATHPYRSENCVNRALQLSYRGNYPVGGNYKMAPRGQDIEQGSYTLPNDPETYGDELQNADVLYSVISYKKGKVEETKDCWFDHAEWRSSQIIRLDRVSPAAARALGVRKGQLIRFECKESTDMPNGNHCD